jgi:hypothetical protein
MLVFAVSPAAAQTPDLVRLRERVKSEEISLTLLLQTLGEYDGSRRSGAQSGFRIPNARIALSGLIARRHWSYLLQANFAGAPSLLDLRVGYHPRPAVAIDVGQFKAPFSQEALIGAGSLEFTERAPVVTALAPGRQVGSQLRVTLASGGADLSAGVFNGNGQGRVSNDNGGVLAVARLAFYPARARGTGLRLELAMQAATSQDSAAPIGNLIPAFAGRRRLLGSDLRMEWHGWLLAGEAIGAWLDAHDGSSHNPVGWYVTGGRSVGRALQLLGRWERLDTDGLGRDENLLLLGGQIRPDETVRLRLHYGLPLSHDPLGRQRLVGGVQMGF